jgi:hypothetical protein
VSGYKFCYAFHKHPILISVEGAVSESFHGVSLSLQNISVRHYSPLISPTKEGTHAYDRLKAKMDMFC